MSHPTPMDVAEAEDRDADLSPSEQLRNICAALTEDLNESPFTREEWERLDTERLELLAANDALAARLAEAETDAAYAQSLSLKLAAVENALFKIRNTAVDALNELIAVARGRECGACGRAIPPGGSTSCSLDHAALAPTDQPEAARCGNCDEALFTMIGECPVCGKVWPIPDDDESTAALAGEKP